MSRSNRSRREFLKKAGLAGAALTLGGAVGCARRDADAVDPALDTAGRSADDTAGTGADSRFDAGAEGSPGSGTRSTQDSKERGPQEKVPRRQLGASGISVPILFLGAGDTFDPRYDKILHRAFRDGVNALDTAMMYSGGMTHRTLAPFLRQVGRENVFVMSKGRPTNRRPSQYLRDIDVCLEELETDYLDVYQLHAAENPRLLDRDFLRVGEQVKKQGKARLFGFSTCGRNVVEMMNKAAQVGGIDMILFRYSFARYGDLALNKAIDACRRAGIGLIAMKTQNAVPGYSRLVLEFRSREFTIHQARLKAVWADERIDALVSQMDNTRKLSDNVAAARSPTQLSMRDFQQLRAVATATAGLACQGCGEICESRYAGPVKVAHPLRCLMYLECYGEPARARRRYRELRPAERDFDSVDFAAASRACPQGIDIAARLQVARERLERLV